MNCNDYSKVMSSGSGSCDLFHTYKWTSLATCVVLILLSFIDALENFNELGDSDEQKTIFYDTHIYKVIENMSQFVICCYGLYADSSEEYQKVLLFDSCLSILFLYKVVILFLSITFGRAMTMSAITCLVIISWLYLCEINKSRRAHPSNTKDDRILVEINK